MCLSRIYQPAARLLLFGLTRNLSNALTPRAIRSTSPLDDEPILESVESTNRLGGVDEANPRCGMAADISALVAQNAFSALHAPIQMVTAPHTPVPFNGGLEDLYKPNAERIMNAVRQVAEYQAWQAPASKG